MLVSNERYKRDQRSIEQDLKEMHEKYWKLRHQYMRLMDHLGLQEREYAGVEIIKKESAKER